MTSLDLDPHRVGERVEAEVRQARLERADEQVHVERRWLVPLDAQARRVMISYEAPEPAVSYLRDRGYEPVEGCGGAIAVAPCLPGFCAGLRFARRPEGISPRGRIGLLISHEAGAVSASETTRPFPEAIDAHAMALLVACDEATLEELSGALRAI